MRVCASVHVCAYFCEGCCVRVGVRVPVHPCTCVPARMRRVRARVLWCERMCARVCLGVCGYQSVHRLCVCVRKRECAGLRPGASVCKRTDTRRYVVRTQQETTDDAVAVLQPNVRMAPSQLTKQLRAHYRPPPLSSRTSPLDRQITPRLTLPLALSDLAAAPAT